MRQTIHHPQAGQPPPLVGLLQNRLGLIVAKRGGLALGLWGEAGSGKTHTAQQVLGQISCRSFSFGVSTPLPKLIQGLPRSRKLPLWAEALATRLEQGEALDSHHAAEAVGAMLAALAPVVLHLDDLHEATTAQHHFVRALAEQVPRLKGVGLLVSSRERLPEGFQVWQMQALSRDEVRGMLEAEVGTALPEEALLWIEARAGGNPLFSLEFFRYLARQGFVWNDGQRWRWREPAHQRMPATVEALIERTLHEGASTPELVQALEARAVLGTSDPILWARVLGLTGEALTQLVQPLEASGILRANEFAHPLYQEVLRDNLRPERRRNLARSILQHLQDDPRTAAGFVHQAQLEAPSALELLTRAARAASEAGNPLQAARFQAQATAYAVGPEQARLALEAAQGLRQADLKEASRLAEMAALEPSLAIPAGVLVAELLAAQGWLEEAERRLGFIEVSELERAMLGLSLRTLARDFVGAAELWQHNPQLRTSDNPRVIQAAVRALLSTNRYPEARLLLHRALTQLELSPNDRRVLEGGLAILLYHEGQTEAAIALWAERVEQLLQDADLRGAAQALHNQGAALQALGRLKATLPLHKQCVQLYAEVGDLRAHANALSTLAWTLWHLGEYQEAETLFLQSRDLLRSAAPSDFLVECEGCLSLLYLDWSPPLAADLANKHASAALEVARSLGNPYDIVASLHDLVLARLRQGKPQEALPMAEEMAQLAALHHLRGLAINARYCQALTLEALGEADKALEMMQAAENEHQGGQTFKHKIGIEVARMSGDLPKALHHLGWFESNQMYNGVQVLQRYFPELAVQADQATPPAQPTVRLEVLGPMRLVQQDHEQPVRGSKRRELLGLLLDARIAGRSEVARLDLLDALYPGSDEVQANTSLKDIVYQVRELCTAQTIQTTENGYALGAVDTDVEEFLRTGNTRLWRGAYLEGLDPHHDTVNDTLHLALRNRAEAIVQEDPVEAARIGQLLCEAEPYSAENLRLTLRALRASKNHKALSRTYARARERLSEVGEALPDSWTEFIA